MKQNFPTTLSLILLFALVLSGCASMEKNHVMNTEELLSAAGFRMKIADTPEKLAHLKSMQQRTFLTHSKDGYVYYSYADAEFCKCLYMGTEGNYRDFSHLYIQQNNAETNLEAAEMNQDAAMNWGPWGGWGAWGPWY